MSFADFDKRVSQQNANFAREFKRAQRWALLAGLSYATVVLSVLGFLGWVIVKVMQHFQII